MSAMTSDWATPTAEAPERRSVFHAIVGRIRRHIAVQRNRRILHELPDFLLRDMGVERAQIDDIVAGRIDRYGRPTGLSVLTRETGRWTSPS